MSDAIRWYDTNAEDVSRRYESVAAEIVHGRQCRHLQPAQAAWKTRFLWGVARKALACGRGIFPQKPSQPLFISKPPDFFGLVRRREISGFGKKGCEP
jgi:hypothetical protein